VKLSAWYFLRGGERQSRRIGGFFAAPTRVVAAAIDRPRR
jgi:hypothetical protein